jgi:hypothetical protein
MNEKTNLMATCYDGSHLWRAIVTSHRFVDGYKYPITILVGCSVCKTKYDLRNEHPGAFFYDAASRLPIDPRIVEAICRNQGYHPHGERAYETHIVFNNRTGKREAIRRPRNDVTDSG